MAFKVGTVSVSDRVNPQTTSVALTKPRNQIFLCTLQGVDGRDIYWNTNTFNGAAATLAGVAKQDSDPTFATVALYYYLTNGLQIASYNHIHQCTTGGPDNGACQMHVLITGCAPVSAVTKTETATGAKGTPTDTIAVANNGSLLVSVYTSQANANFTLPTGHTELFNNRNTESEGIRQGASYKVCSAGTETVTWTGGASDKWAMVCMVIKPDNSGGGFLINML